VYAGLETIQEYACCTGTDACGETAPPCECGETATGCGDGWPLAREFEWGDANRFPEPIVMVDFTGAGMPNTWDPEAPVPTPPIFYYYLHDALGSVVALTDNVGRLVERYTYDPYGRVVVEQPDDQDGPADANPCTTGCDPVEWVANICGDDEVLTANSLTYSAYGNPFMWTAQRHDAVTGTYHFHARTYLPHLGRWGQRDPAGYLDGVNLYEYVRSNATGYVDPLGLLSASSAPIPPSAESKPSESSSNKPCPEDDDCLKRATKKAHDDKGALEGEDYNSFSNDHKIFHCLESCHAVKECTSGQGALDLKNAGLGAAFRNLQKVATGALIGVGGIGYEILRGVGISPPNMKGANEQGHGWEFRDKETGEVPFFDKQHPIMWAIDTPGDVAANLIGIAAALAGKDCKAACRSAHKIPGPDYTPPNYDSGGPLSPNLESPLNGEIVPIGPGKFRQRRTRP